MLLPTTYVLSMIWSWVRRDRLRAQSGVSGLLVAAWIFLSLMPRLVGESLGTMILFQPDLGVTFVAGAVTGVLWAVFRLAVAYAGTSLDQVQLDVRGHRRQEARAGTDDSWIPEHRYLVDEIKFDRRRGQTGTADPDVLHQTQKARMACGCAILKFRDHGLTGTNRARPGLREALAACRSGDTLVVAKLDRLARSLRDIGG